MSRSARWHGYAVGAVAALTGAALAAGAPVAARAVVHARLDGPVTLRGRAGVDVRVDLVSARLKNALPGDLLHIPYTLSYLIVRLRETNEGRAPLPPAAVTVVVLGAGGQTYGSDSTAFQELNLRLPRRLAHDHAATEAIAFLVPHGDRRVSVRCSVAGGATVVYTL